MGPEIYDSDIQYHLAPIMKSSIDWLQERLIPEEKVNGEIPIWRC